MLDLRVACAGRHYYQGACFVVSVLPAPDSPLMNRPQRVPLHLQDILRSAISALATKHLLRFRLGLVAITNPAIRRV